MDYYRQTQVFSNSQPPPERYTGSPAPFTPAPLPPTPGFVTPAPLRRNRPRTVSRPQNPDPNFPSEALVDLVEDQIKDRFNEVYDLIVRANQLTKTRADADYWSPELSAIQRSVAMFVPTMGARRKSHHRRSRRRRSRR